MMFTSAERVTSSSFGRNRAINDQTMRKKNSGKQAATGSTISNKPDTEDCEEDSLDTRRPGLPVPTGETRA
eukprot:6180442-Pleurochrysis_carterae.AAC.5